MEHHEVIVAGLGAMGSATVYQLAKRGADVLGFDRFAPPHSHGSTHGDTRITRLAIGEGTQYVPLVLRSHQLWREIEAETGADLLTNCGGLVLARPESAGEVHGKTRFLERTIAAATAFGITHELLDIDELGARFPQFALVGDERGYFEPEAGFLRPEACVAAQLQLAERNGAEIHRDETLVDFASTASGVVVTTNRGRYEAATLVLATGPWLPRHLPPRYAAHVGVYEQIMHWFSVAPPLESMAPGRFPVFIWEIDGTSFYGFPAIDGPDGGLKIADEEFDHTVSPDADRAAVSAEAGMRFFDRVAGRRFPQLQRRELRAVSCLYTTTSDGDFVIDRHPEHPRVLLVSPCSGHGFKHSAAIGEAVAQLATEGSSAVDLSGFALARFDTAAGSPG